MCIWGGHKHSGHSGDSQLSPATLPCPVSTPANTSFDPRPGSPTPQPSGCARYVLIVSLNGSLVSVTLSPPSPASPAGPAPRVSSPSQNPSHSLYLQNICCVSPSILSPGPSRDVLIPPSAQPPRQSPLVMAPCRGHLRVSPPERMSARGHRGQGEWGPLFLTWSPAPE